jgi:hypothetical protein
LQEKHRRKSGSKIAIGPFYTSYYTNALGHGSP